MKASSVCSCLVLLVAGFVASGGVPSPSERDHEMGCREAVRRSEEDYGITNLDQFGRKKVVGKTSITRNASNQRIGGTKVELCSD